MLHHNDIQNNVSSANELMSNVYQDIESDEKNGFDESAQHNRQLAQDTEELIGFCKSITEEELNLIQKHRDGYRGIYWHPNDIIDAARENEELKEITRKQAEDILEELIEQHDCEYGISWQTIFHHILDYQDWQERV